MWLLPSKCTVAILYIYIFLFGGNSNVCSICHLLKISVFQMFELERLVKVIEYNIRSDIIKWLIQISIKVIPHVFTQTLTVSETLRFEKFDLANLGEVLWVQHSYERHWMANTSFLFDSSRNIWISRHLFVEIATWKAWPWKLKSRAWSTSLVMVIFDYTIDLYKCHAWAFFVSAHRFRDSHF